MSDQGAVHEGAIGSGDGVETRANPPDLNGVSGYDAPPTWLGPIEARMDELRDQNAAIADRLGGYADYGYDPEEFADEDDEWSDLGVDSNEWAEIEADDAERIAAMDPIDQMSEALDRRIEAQQAERDLQQRDLDYDELKARYPLLQHEQSAYEIVKRAQRLAENWNPEILTSPLFVQLIELTARAAMAERVQAGKTLAQAQQPRVQLESAAGAGQHSQRPQPVDWGDRIVKAAEKLRPRI